MEIKKILWILLLLSSVFSSCKKDEDETGTVTDDPRIRTMTINGISAAFVVNDMEGLIYNYDSLSYGTKINSLLPVFSGYASNLSYRYIRNGNWLEFANAGKDTLDFSSPVSIKVVAPDSNYTKEYTVNIRVHKYDVEAFAWTKSAEKLPVRGDVVSQKTFFYKKQYYFFYRNSSGENYLLVSADGDSWTENEITTDNAGWNPDWTTLASMYSEQTLAVQAVGGLYVCKDLEAGSAFSLSDAVLPEKLVLKAPLFTLGDNFWVIAGEGDGSYLCYLPKGAQEFQKKELLSPEVPVSGITSYVSQSGSATATGCILGGSEQTGVSIWAIDINGNIVKWSAGKSVFPFRIQALPLFFRNRLYVAGGETATGVFNNQFYESSNTGMTWSENSHKLLPEEVAAGALFEYERNKIILIGGRNSQGFQPYIWKGVLKQELLNN